MNIHHIYHALKHWKTLTDSFVDGIAESEKEIMKYLNQGTHFSIDGKEISKWKETLEYESHPSYKAIHAYIGIVENTLKFFLIDSKSDAEGDFSSIVIKDFNRIPPENFISSPAQISSPPITADTAVYRNFRFNMYCSAWLKVPRTEFFRLIVIPFGDYEGLDLAHHESCTCFFGLTTAKKDDAHIGDYHIEIIIVKDITVDTMSKTAENYSTPRPPFTLDSETDYKLLLKSDAYV